MERIKYLKHPFPKDTAVLKLQRQESVETFQDTLGVLR